MLAESESLYDGKKGKINHSFKKCALYDASTSLGRIHPSCFTSIIISWTVAYWNVIDNHVKSNLALEASGSHISVVETMNSINIVYKHAVFCLDSKTTSLHVSNNNKCSIENKSSRLVTTIFFDSKKRMS